MMEWYNILTIVIGAFGGVSGLISLYNAKSNKTTIDIGNMEKMLHDAEEMYNVMKQGRAEEQEEFRAYKKENMKYIAEFKLRFEKLEDRLDKAEDAVFHLKSAIYQGYRCKFPQHIEDCPVIKEYEKKHCEDCISYIEKQQ